MSTVSTRVLKDQLSSYRQRAEGTEQQRLAELESRGLVTLPCQTERNGFQGPAFPSRGKPASEMVSEDRR